MSLVAKKIRDFPRDPDVHCVICDEPECCWCHLPYHDAGMGQKTDDFLGAPLCFQCHNYADGRAETDGAGYYQSGGCGRSDYEWHYIALRRGLKLLFDAGVIRV